MWEGHMDGLRQQRTWNGTCVRNQTLNSSWEWEAVPGNGQATGTLVMLLVNLSYQRLVTLLV